MLFASAKSIIILLTTPNIRYPIHRIHSWIAIIVASAEAPVKRTIPVIYYAAIDVEVGNVAANAAQRDDRVGVCSEESHVVVGYLACLSPIVGQSCIHESVI